MGSEAVASTPGAGVSQVSPSLVDARQSLGSATLDDLFPEGEAFRRSLQTYVALLALAAFIASFGLYQDSVASIIGAMVVAPLGGAMMAFAGALVTGRTRWQTISFLQVVLGGLMVVAIGFLVSWVIPDPLTLTPALDARTAPGILDLGVALTAGAAGAYVAARHTGNGRPAGSGDRGLPGAAAGHGRDLSRAGPSRRRGRRPRPVPHQLLRNRGRRLHRLRDLPARRRARRCSASGTGCGLGSSGR